MSERTGLGPWELAVLEAVAAEAEGRRRRTTAVLRRLDGEAGIGPDYALPVMRDLGVSWRVHLRLLDLAGNWGSMGDDPMADPRYTDLRLSRLGELLLASERGEVGPVPIGLIDGSLYRGGSVPPLGPTGVVRALWALLDEPDTPYRNIARLFEPLALPSGGCVEGQLTGLFAGRRSRLRLASRFEHERDERRARLVITGMPLGVSLDTVVHMLARRANDDRSPPRVLDVCDESTARTGIRVTIGAPPDADLYAVEQWARDVWPAALDTALRLPGKLDQLLRGWATSCGHDRSGLEWFTELAQ